MAGPSGPCDIRALLRIGCPSNCPGRTSPQHSARTLDAGRGERKTPLPDPGSGEGSHRGRAESPEVINPGSRESDGERLLRSQPRSGSVLGPQAVRSTHCDSSLRRRAPITLQPSEGEVLQADPGTGPGLTDRIAVHRFRLRRAKTRSSPGLRVDHELGHGDSGSLHRCDDDSRGCADTMGAHGYRPLVASTARGIHALIGGAMTVAFSDGVFAVAITLLVLEFTVPAGYLLVRSYLIVPFGCRSRRGRVRRLDG